MSQTIGFTEQNLYLSQKVQVLFSKTENRGGDTRLGRCANSANSGSVVASRVGIRTWAGAQAL